MKGLFETPFAETRPGQVALTCGDFSSKGALERQWGADRRVKARWSAAAVPFFVQEPGNRPLPSTLVL